MMSPPESSTREVLAGLVERVTFHNAENGFCVLRAKARGHRDLVCPRGRRDVFPLPKKSLDRPHTSEQ
jgi:exodeoxyribonuclease V alpha subunit